VFSGSKWIGRDISTILFGVLKPLSIHNDLKEQATKLPTGSFSVTPGEAQNKARDTNTTALSRRFISMF